MTTEVVNTRKSERFTVVATLPGTFGPAEVTIANISLGGLQIVHTAPLRIGTRARISFQYRDMAIAAPARLVWSHLSKQPTESGKFQYASGLQLDAPDPTFAAAINSMFRVGAIEKDSDSMDRKRARIQEREEARKALLQTKPSIPTGGGMPEE